MLEEAGKGWGQLTDREETDTRAELATSTALLDEGRANSSGLLSGPELAGPLPRLTLLATGSTFPSPERTGATEAAGRGRE